jgi:hypothetical protein
VPRPHRAFGDVGALACEFMVSIIIIIIIILHHHHYNNRTNHGLEPTQRPWRWAMILEYDTSNSLGTWTPFDSFCCASDHPQKRACSDVVGEIILISAITHAGPIKAFPRTTRSLSYAGKKPIAAEFTEIVEVNVVAVPARNGNKSSARRCWRFIIFVPDAGALLPGREWEKRGQYGLLFYWW